MEPGFIEIGRILKTRGLKGELKVLPYTDSPQSLCELAFLHIQDQTEQFERVNILQARVSGTTAFLRLEGIDTREQAQRLVGRELFIEPSQMRPLAEGRYYQRDLLECEVCGVDGTRLGVVTDLMDVPQGSLLVVKLSDPEPERTDDEALIPFIPEFVRAVDLDQKRITVDLPEGLI